MPRIEKHPAGAFCWIELGTTDQKAAKSFYGNLFGWSAEDHQMGPESYYTMFQLDGRQTGATYTLGKDMLARGVPPHWMLYVAVENADDTAKRAAAAGGTVTAQPFDVFDIGRMAVIQDPTGAVFSIWQPKTHTGMGIAGEDNTFCWADLNTPDQARAAKFYAEAIGWRNDEGQKESGYIHLMNGETHIGGILPPKSQAPGVPPHWLIYFKVRDCDAAAAKAKSLGARIHLAPMTLEKVGRFCVLADPQGATFALYQPLAGA